MSGEAVLDFADVESLQDLGTFVGRARTLSEDGSVRLQATGSVLAAWVNVLPGQGLLGKGVVLGLRTMPLAPDRASGDLDATVPLAAISDRLARRAGTGDTGTVLPVPPMRVTAQWAGLTPPRSGWEPAGTVPADTLLEAARAGIAEVAQGAPTGSGALAVSALRERVWGRPVSEDHPQVPAGTGLAAYSLGFVRPGDQVRVFRAGSWLRLSAAAGHILTR